MGKVYFLAQSVFTSKIFCLWYHICANLYAYPTIYWLLLQEIYTFALIYSEEKGGTFCEMCAIPWPVTKSPIPINKYLEKLHDLKCSFKLFLLKFPSEFIKFYSR